MPEMQNIEYKESWRDDFIKTICGFANAQGGDLYIGIDDRGTVKGITESKRMMEDIPNKVRNHLGILVEVNLLRKDGKDYLQIVTGPSDVPISYKGAYYYRSGSTTQELAGAQLSDFLLRKSGRSWDDIVEERATIADIDDATVFKYLKNAEKSSKLPDNGNTDTFQILEKLHLTEGTKLKRAAIILFGKDPRKFYPNAFVKIGRIGNTEAELLHQDEIETNLIQAVDSIISTLNNKYIARSIKIEGITREETDQYPLVALRETILNALVHRRYTNSPVFIKVYDDKITVWNDGELPDGLTVKSLQQAHPSKPRNPVIAQACFRGGYVEQWGSGTLRIIESCKKAKLPAPDMEEESGGFSITLYSQREDKYSAANLSRLNLNKRQMLVMEYLEKKPTVTTKEYIEMFNVSRNTASADLNYMVANGLLKKIKGKSNSSFYELAYAH